MIQNRKTATKLLMVQWSRFQNVTFKLEGSTLITGINGSGKSTVLDAMTYLLTGNRQFNQAAKDRDRNVKGYVRGDTKSNGSSRYLRKGQVVSYVAMEFWSPADMQSLVIGVCIESTDEVSAVDSKWFYRSNAALEDFNFACVKDGRLFVTPKSMLRFKGERLSSAFFKEKENGIREIFRLLGLRCELKKYQSKLQKMMAFRPENNIDQFICECVLEPGNMNSLTELKEQRDQFDNIKKIYEDLRDGKKQLEIIEEKIQVYEKKKKMLDIKEMMFTYQDFLQVKKEQEDIETRVKFLENEKIHLEEKKKILDADLENARVRLQAAETNDIFKGMQESIQALTREMDEFTRQMEQAAKETKKLEKLQQAFEHELSWCAEGFPGLKNDPWLYHLSQPGYALEKKSQALAEFFAYAEAEKDKLHSLKVHKQDEEKEHKNRLSELNDTIKRLDANIVSYPKNIEKEREILNRKLAEKGIHTEVKMFAELVSQVKDISWRTAIETFLGRKRFHLIVDGKYCEEAMKILQKENLHSATVVITDKLPKSEETQGSAAAQLVIPNTFARRYANYLLNPIHLCSSVEELHKYPKGGLTRDGMLAKSYAVSNMDTERTDICLGQDIILLQKEKAQREKEETKMLLSACREELYKIGTQISSLNQMSLKMEDYHLDAPDRFRENEEKRADRQKNIENMQNNPDFLAVMEERDRAKKAYDQVERTREENTRKTGANASERSRQEELRKIKAGEYHIKEQRYEELREREPQWEAIMLEEYEKQYAKKNEIKVISERSIQNTRTDLEKSISDLEDQQLEYCRISGISTGKRGTGYIPFYREEYRNIANIKIEEAHSRLEQQSEKLESAFMNDFVAELNERIQEARSEIELINRELKQIPFGQDTYKFKMTEKADRRIFFNISRKLEDYLNSTEYYINSGREDEELERDIREFMDMILSEEDETEYTDYRKYFTYDMEISSHQGEEKVIADLSRKQGSASNGEKQTPYFIILAASLMQCYPKNACCARLAFIDEAFSALSNDRIEQMVRYLEDNNFQVIYAAPPEKIGSIGQFIKSTVSLVGTGRYTEAVEGLVKLDEHDR